MHLQPPGISRARRTSILEFFETRNATIGQIARGFFSCESSETARKKASRWLRSVSVKEPWIDSFHRRVGI